MNVNINFMTNLVEDLFIFFFNCSIVWPVKIFVVVISQCAWVFIKKDLFITLTIFHLLVKAKKERNRLSPWSR